MRGTEAKGNMRVDPGKFFVNRSRERDINQDRYHLQLRSAFILVDTLMPWCIECDQQEHRSRMFLEKFSISARRDSGFLHTMCDSHVQAFNWASQVEVY